MRKVIAAVALLMLSPAVFGQKGTGDVWAPLRALEGKWQGTGEGSPGKSQVTTEFHLVLGDTYLESKTTSVFPPQEGNANGETHEDWGIVSYDQGRRKFVFRQFHIEGFVNRYVLQEVATGGKKFLFVTEAVENGPPGIGARVTYTLTGENDLHVYFELKWPGKDFARCNESRLKRVQ